MRKIILIAAVLGILALYTVFSTARLSARMRMSAQNMKALYSAFMMYDTDYNCFPISPYPDESLWLLYREYVDDPRIFYNPNDPNKPGEKLSGNPHVSGSPQRIRRDYLDACGYVYVPGYSAKDGNAIIYYERFPTANQRNVLYVDGHVDVLDEAVFQERLKNNPKPLPITK